MVGLGRLRYCWIYIREKKGILESLHKKIAEPLFLLHFQHIVQWVDQSVSESVIDSFRFGDSYRISVLCELV